MENYYKDLPEGYECAKVVDAKSGRVSTILTLGSIVLMVIAMVPVILGLDVSFSEVMARFRDSSMLKPWLVLMASMIVYIILHELTHGAAYKLLTHQKLTFGFTLTVAFCGVPDIYTSRKTALISTAAPLVVFSALFIPLVVYMHSVDQVYYLLAGLLFAIHFGGCVGDMYVIYLFLFKFKDKRSLMNDTGPKQTFYIPV